MCFEKPPKKWLFETHVASQHKTHSGGTALHVGPVTVQRILRVPVTVIVPCGRMRAVFIFPVDGQPSNLNSPH